MPERPIDIVIPVFKGFEETRRCVESVLASIDASRARAVVVNDASPEPRMAGYLEELARAARITLLANDANVGFVESVNRGMSLGPSRDVVLLNSDTEVANDWVERLRRCAYRADRVATVTPFSNNATICSYPFHGWNGGLPGTIGLARLDRLFATVNSGRAIEIPTAVGFCMFIRRDALDALGLFDAKRFGRGYGEENDFSMRALKAGWHNLLAGDVFVFHEGGVSFGNERDTLTPGATKALLEVHPDYAERVMEWIRRDPAAPLRAAIDAELGPLSRPIANHDDSRIQRNE